MQVIDFMQRAVEFKKGLLDVRAEAQGISWYPYDTMSNTVHMCKLLPEEMLAQIAAGELGWSVLDVGAADGDLGLFFEAQGCNVDFIDNVATNFNNCDGIKESIKRLGSRARLGFQDIDQRFELEGQYDFAIAFGLLYHLKNPMAFLTTLAMHSERMILSTRIANHFPDGKPIGDQPIGFFLGALESNNDPTNFWVFTKSGLEGVLRRSGWTVKSSFLAGAEKSEPLRSDADQRMFVYCERVSNWADLDKHHHF